MRFYKYRGVPVIESDFLLAWNKRARGFAALFFIVHKVPATWRVSGMVYPYNMMKKAGYDIPSHETFIHSFTGKKSKEAILKHEFCHIEQMRKHGRIKFLWKYFTDKEFHKQQEDEAKRAEHE